MAAKSKANSGNKESERENKEKGSNTDNDSDTDLDTSVHADHETPRILGSSTPIDPAKLTNTTAGNQGPSTENLFEQLLIQHKQMQQQNKTLMTQMIRRLSSLEGTSPRMDPPANYRYKLSVPKWIMEMSFEACKWKIINFKTQSSMN